MGSTGEAKRGKITGQCRTKRTDESKGRNHGQRGADQSSTAYGITLRGCMATFPSLTSSIRKKYDNTNSKRTAKPRRLNVADKWQ